VKTTRTVVSHRRRNVNDDVVVAIVVVVVVVAASGCVPRTAVDSTVLSACSVSYCSPDTVHCTSSTASIKHIACQKSSQAPCPSGLRELWFFVRIYSISFLARCRTRD